MTNEKNRAEDAELEKVTGGAGNDKEAVGKNGFVPIPIYMGALGDAEPTAADIIEEMKS